MPKPFVPDELPISNLDWKRLVPIVGTANAAIARYDGFLQSMVNPAVLLSPITTKEAVLSSKIEGTVATLSDVLQHEAGEEYDEGKTQDIQEVLNYRFALLRAEQMLEERPLSLNLVRQTHAILLRGVRGKDKNPGAFRADQVFVGRATDTIETARYVPPPPMILQDHLEAWERYGASNDDDPLIQMAVIHAQFEIIHPFNDGNGRIGRILIPLFLHKKKVLHRPMFYLSEYLDDHRDEYYDHLLAITEEGNWQGWIEFFLQASCVQAERNTARARKILDLYHEMKIAFVEATHSQFSQAALDAFFQKPILNSTEFQNLANVVNRATAGALLRALEQSKLIMVLRKGSGRTPSRYVFPKLINIAEDRDVFPDPSVNKKGRS
jgi:Fic family protein